MITITVVISPASSRRSRRSRGQQPVEEGPVPLQRLSQLFGVGVATPLPLRLQPSLVLAETLSQRLHQVRHQAVGCPYRLLRVIDEAGLDITPPLPETLLVGGVEKPHVTAAGFGAARSAPTALVRGVGRSVHWVLGARSPVSGLHGRLVD